MKREGTMEDKTEMLTRMDHVFSSEVGDIVAVRLDDGRVKSAKIIRKSTADQVLKLETAYGATFIVAFSNIVWVKKSGEMWPREIHRKLKSGA